MTTSSQRLSADGPCGAHPPGAVGVCGAARYAHRVTADLTVPPYETRRLPTARGSFAVVDVPAARIAEDHRGTEDPTRVLPLPGTPRAPLTPRTPGRPDRPIRQQEDSTWPAS